MTQPSHSFLNDSKSTGQNFLNFYRLVGERKVGKENFNIYIEYYKKLMPNMSRSDKVGIFEECAAMAANAVAR